jgi:hypothetical protein
MALPRKGDVQPVEGVAGGVPIPISGGVVNRPAFATNQKNVTTPGTAVQLQTQAIPDGFTIYIRARATNTGKIYVGSSAANAQNHAVAEILEAGAYLTYGITNADLVYIDADVGAEGVMWTVEV